MTEQHTMTVREARKKLKNMPQDAVLLICGHAFPGMEGRGWVVSHFENAADRGSDCVLIEGAGPVEESVMGDG